MTQTLEQNVPALRFPECNGEWALKRLQDVAYFQNGKAHEQDISSSGDFVVVNSKFISTEGRIKKFTDTQISPLVVGDIVMVMSDIPKGRALAKCYLIEQDNRYSLNQRICSLKAREAVPYFLFLVTNRNDYFLKFDSGVSQTNLRKDEVLRCPAYYPPLPEQQKIAAFLSSVDRRIAQLGQKKELLQQYKKGMMQKLFSQELRFKDKQGHNFPDWEEKRVSEVFQVTRGSVLAVSKMTQLPVGESTYPVYSSQTKNNGLTGYFPEYLYENAITWTTDGANAGDVKFRKGKFYCTNVCGVLISENGFANACIAEMLDRVTERFVSYVGNPKLMNNVMSQIKIKYPSLPEQQKIADFLSSIDRKIDLISTELDHAKTFKKGLLQQMFI